MTQSTDQDAGDPVFDPAVRDEQRLEALHDYDILDTPPEDAFDRLTRIAADLFGVEVAFAAVLDTDRQWFRSSVGLDRTERSLAASFCTHTIANGGPLVIEDATDDEWTEARLSVTEAGLRFYAGVPICAPDGEAIGTFSIMDSEPQSLSEEEEDSVATRALRTEETVVVTDLQALDNPIDYGTLQSVAAIPIAGHGVIVLGQTGAQQFEPINLRLLEVLGTYASMVLDRLHGEEALRKAKEEAEAASRLKSAMLANMSHEIRTPSPPSRASRPLSRSPRAWPASTRAVASGCRLCSASRKRTGGRWRSTARRGWAPGSPCGCRGRPPLMSDADFGGTDRQDQ